MNYPKQIDTLMALENMTYFNSHQNDIFSSKNIFSSRCAFKYNSILCHYHHILLHRGERIFYSRLYCQKSIHQKTRKDKQVCIFLETKKSYMTKKYTFLQISSIALFSLYFLSFLPLFLDYTFFLKIETFFMLFITDQRCYLFPTSRVHFRFRRAAKCGKDTKWKMRTKKATSRKALPLLDSMHFIVCLKNIVTRLLF